MDIGARLRAEEEFRRQEAERQAQQLTEDLRQAYAEKEDMATVVIISGVPSGVVACAMERFHAERDGMGAPVAVHLCSRALSQGSSFVYVLVAGFKSH